MATPAKMSAGNSDDRTVATKSSSHVIFLIDGSAQSVSQEGDQNFNGLRDCDSHVVKRRVEILVDVAKTLAVEGFGWRKDDEENVRKRFGCIFYDASNARESGDALARTKQKRKRLGCSMQDLKSVLQFFATLKHEEHETNCAFQSLQQAVSQAVLMFKASKTTENDGTRDLVVLNATEGLQNLSLREMMVDKLEKMKVTRSAVFFHGDHASPSSSCLWPTAIEGLKNSSGVAAICNLRPHQDMFLRQSERCLRAELECGGVLLERTDEEETNGETTEQKRIEDALNRNRILEKNRVQENAMFPTKLSDDDCDGSHEELQHQKQVVRYAENCAAQFSKFDVLEERLSSLNPATSLRVPILMLRENNDSNRDKNEENGAKENQESNSGDAFIHHVDVELENIPKVLHALHEPLLVLTECSRMRHDKSKKVRALHGTSGDVIVRQEHFLGNKQEPKVIIEFRKNDGGIDRIASFNRSASKSVSLIWPLKNADARVFCLKHEFAKYKKFFYFHEGGESNAERVAQFRAILENPPSLEELSGVQSSKTLRDMALAAPTLLNLMCKPIESRPPPIQIPESSPSSSTFTLEKYRQLELEQKERREKIRAALTKRKNKSKAEEEPRKSTPPQQVITDRLQALREELEIRLKETEQDAKAAQKTTKKYESAKEEEEEEENNTEDEGASEARTSENEETDDTAGKKINRGNLLSFFELRRRRKRRSEIRKGLLE